MKCFVAWGLAHAPLCAHIEEIIGLGRQCVLVLTPESWHVLESRQSRPEPSGKPPGNFVGEHTLGTCLPTCFRIEVLGFGSIGAL